MRTTAVLIFLASCLSVDTVAAHELNPAVVEQLTGETITNEHGHQNERAEADPRLESRTLYSFPEWYIVYSAQEYGRFVTAGGRPSQYPYWRSITQFWDSWEQAEAAAGVPPDETTHTVLWTIAISYSIETAIIGFYENTFGRVGEWLHFGYKTTEDRYLDTQAVTYGKFLHQTPWYDFPYFATLGGLWQTYGWSSVLPRGIERRVIYTIGYGIKGMYAATIGYLSEASFDGGAGAQTPAVVSGSEAALATLAEFPVEKAEAETYRVVFPRYRAFRDPAVAFALAGGDFITIADNTTIALSLLVPDSTTCSAVTEHTELSLPLVSEIDVTRHVLLVPVDTFANVVRQLNDCDLDIEHVYDY